MVLYCFVNLCNIFTLMNNISHSESFASTTDSIDVWQLRGQTDDQCHVVGLTNRWQQTAQLSGASFKSESFIQRGKTDKGQHQYVHCSNQVGLAAECYCNSNTVQTWDLCCVSYPFSHLLSCLPPYCLLSYEVENTPPKNPKNKYVSNEQRLF